MVNLITRLRRKIFGLNRREKRAAAIMASIVITPYQREPQPDDFDFDRDLTWGMKTLNPEQATRIAG